MPEKALLTRNSGMSPRIALLFFALLLPTLAHADETAVDCVDDVAPAISPPPATKFERFMLSLKNTVSEHGYAVGIAGGMAYTHGDFSPAMPVSGTITVNAGYALKLPLTIEAVTGLDVFTQASRAGTAGSLGTSQTLWAIPFRFGIRYEPRIGQWVPMVAVRAGASLLRTSLHYDQGETVNGWLPSISGDVGVGIGYLWHDVVVGLGAWYVLHAPVQTNVIGNVLAVLEIRYRSVR